MRLSLLRWYVSDAERKDLVRVLFRLSDASWQVPIKQYDRTQEDQAAVEEFTSAVVEARELLDSLAEAHVVDLDASSPSGSG